MDQLLEIFSQLWDNIKAIIRSDAPLWEAIKEAFRNRKKLQGQGELIDDDDYYFADGAYRRRLFELNRFRVIEKNDVEYHLAQFHASNCRNLRFIKPGPPAKSIISEFPNNNTLTLYRIKLSEFTKQTRSINSPATSYTLPWTPMNHSVINSPYANLGNTMITDSTNSINRHMLCMYNAQAQSMGDGFRAQYISQQREFMGYGSHIPSFETAQETYTDEWSQGNEIELERTMAQLHEYDNSDLRFIRPGSPMQNLLQYPYQRVSVNRTYTGLSANNVHNAEICEYKSLAKHGFSTSHGSLPGW